MVRRLRERPRPSRNRQFEELSQPVALRARKLVKRLDAIERDLRAGAQVSARRQDGGVVVTVDFPDLRAKRTAHLTGEEHALLSADPHIAALLAVT